jgi:hypothetical protein
MDEGRVGRIRVQRAIVESVREIEKETVPEKW